MSVKLYPNPPDESTKRALIALQFFYGTFFIIGIMENVLVFRKIRKTKTHRKLSANQLLLLHLTVADILILMTLTPAIFYIDADAKYTSFVACQVLLPMVTFYPNLRLLTQVIIALERRRAIVTPLKPRFTRAAIVSMLSLCWLLSAVFTAPVMWVASFGPQSCGDGKPYRLRKGVYYTLKMILLFLLPLIIISVCYIQAGLALRRSRHRLASQIKSNAFQHEASRLKNIRVCKAFASMIFVFVVCTAPLNAICLWVEYGSGRHHTLENRAMYCFLANFPVLFMSFVDPLIYGTCCLRCSLWKKVCDKLVSWKN